ncbi:MAG TPA: polysaccharide biosynthesis tyrosine autokinase [Stellaceae bacterium]|nr:polysaccharide biosynthesis tyrosine autokinase [Stellaceae bacterium]
MGLIPYHLPYHQWNGAEPDLAESNLQQLVNILRRQRRSILAIALIGTALTFTVSAMIPPQFTAKAQIVFDPQTAELGNGQHPSEAAETEAIVQTDITALTSRPFLQHVLDNLSQDPDFRAAARPPRGIRWIGDVLWRNSVGRLRDLMSDFSAPGTSSGQSLTPSQLSRLDAFERDVHVYQELDSHVIAVTFKSTSPEQAALAANRIVQLYISDEQERKRADATRIGQWLDQRIPEVASGLEQDETAVQSYLTAHNLADVSANGASSQRVAELNRQLATAESDLATRQAQLASIRDLRNRGANVDTVVTQLNSPADIELLRRRDELVQAQAEAAVTYGANHPKAQQLSAQLQEIRRALSDEANRAVDRLTSETRAASDRVLSIREQLAGLQSAKSQAEPRLRELNYQAAAAGQLYEGLLQSRARLHTQQGTVLPDVRILSLAAPPDRPSSFSPFLFILPSLIAFAIGGGLVSVAAERLDQGLRSDNEIAGSLGIPCVGLVPRLHGIARTRPHRRLLTEPFTAYAEAIRSVVASSLMNDADASPKSILVTSSVPGEGKTTLAVSIAAYAARIGRRVLLVDLDLRHPGVLREVGGKVHGDILDLLLQGSLPENVVQRLRGFQFDYLPAGRHAYDLFPLFADKRMAQALSRLRELYDLVIIDSPPVLAVTETRLLAGIVDKILFVVKWGTTRRDIAQNALNLLRDFSPPSSDHLGIANAVVMQVDLKKHADYRYGDSGESAATYAEYYTMPGRKKASAPAIRRIVRVGRKVIRHGRLLFDHAMQAAVGFYHDVSMRIREHRRGESKTG